jgi:torulene dioxygenase
MGTFPAVLAGTLYRTGPGTYRAPGSTYQRSHWFDGFTTVHKFQLIVDPKSGTCKVLYNSRSQCDELIEKARRKGTLDGITFGQKRDPCESIFQKIKAAFAPSLDGNDAKLIDSGVTIHPNVSPEPRGHMHDADPDSLLVHLETLSLQPPSRSKSSSA